ncbi:D-alanyl-D-alanine carboxypeptidase family protein [Microaceticoccus formicicus]|uniref:D-alanyl-D-alanine carboxypeptidase family protein n=1 Tax=Microaceticoccus formicicus TaxID=3118105 RepID=UPI003CCFFAAD|nr:D-alanyl-D-alanine carboxypeptidase family protein [Peptoniphilaceae bacterium AMB_02]
MKRRIKSLLFLTIAILIITINASADLGIEDRVQSYLIGDFDSGRVLESYNIDKPLQAASVSKLMTYLVVKDAVKEGKLNLNDRVTVTLEIEAVGGSSLNLLEGEVLTVDELLAGLMVVSGNDAAYALAVKTAGSEKAFTDLMNAKAQELELKSSKFYNSSGLQEGANQNTMSTEDIFKLSRHIIEKYPEVLEYSKIKILNMPKRNFTGESTIPLVGEIPGVDGLKTGFTEEAGYCLVSTIDARKSPQSGEFRLITIVMGTADISERSELSKFLINYGLENYGMRTIIDDKAPYSEVTINSAVNPRVPLYPTESYRILTPKAKRYVYKSEINDGLKAPISVGEKVGTMTLSSEGEDIITVDLIVKHDVEQANLFTRIIRAIENTFRTIATMIRQ